VAQKLWQCDVMGAVHLCELVGRRMVEQRRGSIVLVSSMHAHATYPQRAPYVMAKSALCGLTRALAVEWGPSNVRVNALVPWQVQNERSEAVAAQEWAESGIDTLELYRQRSPLRHLVTAEDIARTVLWLTETPSMSGAEISVDCGVGASMWHRPFLEGDTSVPSP
jgi:NAD(P)-dependent dehydrogenase (short-subunit alcohol dehydrogenase family)